jgi:cell division protein FtsQ
MSAALFRPVDPAVVRRAAAEAERSAFKSSLDAALRTLAAAALSAALSIGAWQAWRWATASPMFTLREFRFTGLSHATEAELIRRSGLALGDNLFRADLPRAARAIESHPWIAAALIERRLPGTLLIRVEEHRPAALVQAGGIYVLDDEGRLFKKAAPEDGLDVPILTGLSRDAWEERALPATGGAQRAEHWKSRRPELQLRLLSALHLLDAWRAANLSTSALSEVRLEEDSGFTLFAYDSGALQEIRLGARDLPLKLRRLAQVRAALARRGERAARIDLDNPARPDQAAATLADKR